MTGISPFLLLLGFGRAENEDTEQFISTFMTNPNGTLSTSLKKSTYGNDQRTGRQALTESLGLWMMYALEKENHEQFEESYQVLLEWFLEEDGFLHWKIEQDGETAVTTNALVDDLRIYHMLIKAYYLWKEEKYYTIADQIGAFLGSHLINNSYFVDFYDESNGSLSPSLTLSYIDEETLRLLNNAGHIPSESYQVMRGMLNNLPLKNGFYPMTYHIQDQQFVFPDEMNMVDQLLVSLNQKGKKDELLTFIKQEMDARNVIYGRYDLSTKEPLVTYESPAVYGLIIMKAEQIGDDELAKKAYQRMIQFRTNQFRYTGAYSIHQGNTHIFDNLIPLIAIEKMGH